MDGDSKERLDRMLEAGEIDRETYDEMMGRWSGKKEITDAGGNKSPRGEKGGDSVIRISGYGKLNDAKGHSLVISGAGTVSGDVEVDMVHVSGSASVDGMVKVGDLVEVSGSMRCKGSVEAGSVVVSGSFSGKSLKCGDAAISGRLRVEEGMECKSVNVSGTTRAREITAEEIRGSGTITADSVMGEKLRIHGAIEAQRVNCRSFVLESMGWSTSIGTLEAESIEVTSRKRLLFSGSRADIREIKGSRVSLENVRCSRITAGEAVIGGGCEIGYLEAKKISVSDKASVKERRVLQ